MKASEQRQSRLRLVGDAPVGSSSPDEPRSAASSPALTPLQGALVASKRTGADDAATTVAGPLATLADAELVALARSGNRAALELLYRRHVGFAIHLAARILGSSADVDDVVQDAFIKGFERLRDLVDPAAFRPWLGSIVVHAVRSRMRRARLMSLLGLSRPFDPVDLDEVASEQASPLVRAQIAQVYALLRTLAVDDRIAWTLRAIEGHDLDTVAHLTRCSLATAKRRIARAQRFLDDHFVDPHHRDDASEQVAP